MKSVNHQELYCQIYHWAATVNKTGCSYSRVRTKIGGWVKALVKKVCHHCGPFRGWQSVIQPKGILPLLLSHVSPAVSLSAFLTGLTSYSSLPRNFPPPVLLPTVYKGLWGILLFPRQHPCSTLSPTLFYLVSPLPPHMVPSPASGRLQLRTLCSKAECDRQIDSLWRGEGHSIICIRQKSLEISTEKKRTWIIWGTVPSTHLFNRNRKRWKK